MITIKRQIINIAKNFGYSFSSNLISLLISTLVTLIIPKIIGVQEYGYWQLYTFYTTYVGFSHFGWADGIYLRYGGEDYENLNKNTFYSQFVLFFSTQIATAIMLLAFVFFTLNDLNRMFIIVATLITMILVNTQYMLNFTLQATNNFKESSSIIIVERIVYFVGIMLLLFSNSTNYQWMIIADILGKFVGFVYATYVCKDIVYQSFSEFSFTWGETKENILAGSKLLYSNIASQLIIGVGRLGIERNWGVATFGKISLTLSISNLFMIFVNALGNVIYPVLRKIKQKELSKFYFIFRNLLTPFTLGILTLYYPLKLILSSWLPQYADSLNYMGILLPIVMYEGRVSLLINPYLKALREENSLVKLNLIALTISSLLTFYATVILDNLDLAILSILISIAARSLLGEYILSKIFKINIIIYNVLEALMVMIFVYSAWFINSDLTPFVYGISYLAYIFIVRNDLKESINNIKGYTKMSD